MPPGLAYLLWRGPAGWARRALRRAHSPKGLALTILGVGLLALALLPQIAMSLRLGPSPGPSDLEALRLWGPLGLLVLALLRVGTGDAIYFRPAEIDFLFPAPLSRRALLAYKIAGNLLALVPVALFMSLILDPRPARLPLSAAGAFMALATMQLLAQLLTLALGGLVQRLRPARRVLSLAGLAAGLFAALWLAQHDLPEVDWARLAQRGIESPPVRLLLHPLRPGLELARAASGVAALAWAGQGLLVLGLLTLALLTLDRLRLEQALWVSQRVQRRLARLRGGQPAGGGRFLARIALPPLPRWGGAGPIIWRELLIASRSLPRLMFLTAVMASPLLVGLIAGRGEPRFARPAVGVLVPLSLLLPILMSPNLGLDIRRDYDRLPQLKALPLPSWVLLLGYMVGGGAALLSMQLAIFALSLLLPPLPSLSWIVAGALLLPLLDLLVLGLDNLLFLLYPQRLQPAGAGDFQFLGAALLVQFLKVVALGGTLALAGGAAALYGFLVRPQPAWMAAAAALMLAPAVIAVAWAAGRAFESFDVTRDTPAA